MQPDSSKTDKSSSSTAFNRQLLQTYIALDNWHKFRLRLFVEGIFVGILGGLAISLFRFLLGEAEKYRIFLYNTYIIPGFSAGDFKPLLFWLAILAIAGLALYGMGRYAPEAGGSGIPQVKGVILGVMRMRWIRILWVKILAGAVGIGAALSLGREGPSIQIGAVAAQGMSRLLGRTRMEERYLITSGASAGLAAAFNAPLAGMMFALEELHRNFSGAVLLPTMTSAITATIVTRFFFGTNTSFTITHLVPVPANHLGYVVILAIASGFAGIFFNWGLLNISKFYNLPIFRNNFMKIAFALLSACFLGFTLPDVLGGGNFLVDKLAEYPYTLSMILLLFVGKYIFTLISYGCGVPGGFFLPLLVIGALLGAAEGRVMVMMGLITDIYIPNIVIIGMVSLFAASVRSPITGTLLILEMTGDFGHLMSLALASAVAYIVAELLHGEPIYDSLLKRSLASHPDKKAEEQRTIVEVPIASGSILENKPLSRVPHLKQTVVVNVKREGQNMIPDPETVLKAGDFIYILTAAKNAERLQKLGEEQLPKDHIRKI